MCVFFFFFQAEDGIRDYKVTGVSDVCSSDLAPLVVFENTNIVVPREAIGDPRRLTDVRAAAASRGVSPTGYQLVIAIDPDPRSEERRVGKECRSRWSPYH